MKRPLARPGPNGYVQYLTRKLPVRIHRELLRLAKHDDMHLQDMVNKVLDLGISYMLAARDLKPLPDKLEGPIDWNKVPEDEPLMHHN